MHKHNKVGGILLTFLLLLVWSVRPKMAAPSPQLSAGGSLGPASAVVGIPATNVQQVVPTTEAKNEKPSNHTNVVVVDVGSSSTKVHVFHFFRKCSDCNILLSEEDFYKRTSPGLSSYVSNPPEGAQTIAKLLEEAEKFVPAKEVEFTPVVVRATAGLRALTEEERGNLLGEVKKVIANSSFDPVSNSVDMMREIDEGVFGWAAVNFLLSRLYKNPSEMVAALDLGGVSTQVTFPLVDADKKSSFPAEDLTTFDVDETDVPLYSHSYLGLGLNAAKRSILTHGNAADATHIVSPCVNPKNNGSTFVYETTTYTVDGVSRPEGQGVDLESCMKVVDELLAPYNITPPHGLHQFDVFAFSGFYWTALNSGLTDPSNNGTVMSRVHEVKKTLCGDPNPHKHPFLCADLVFASSLLERYGLRQNATVHFVKELFNHDISWPLGIAFEIAQKTMIYKKPYFPGQKL